MIKEIQDEWEDVFKTNEFRRFFNENSLYNAFAEATILNVESKVIPMLQEKHDVLKVRVNGETVVLKRKSRINLEREGFHVLVGDTDGFDYFNQSIKVNILIRKVFARCF